MVLGKLPKSFESFIRVVTHDEKKLKVEDVIRKLEKDDLQFRVGHKEEKKGVAFTSERTETRPETRKCYNCNRTGHISRDCRVNSNSGGNRFQPQRNRSNAHFANQSDDEDPIALVATVEEQVSALFGSERKKDTILDSGASEHMFTRREDFQIYQESTGKVQTGEENTKIEVIGEGEVVRYYKRKKVVFKNCLHVPRLPYNLISLTSLWRNKATLEKLNDDRFAVIKNKTVVFEGRYKNKLLLTELEEKEATAQVSEHERLGHAGKSNGCEACQLGKSTRYLEPKTYLKSYR